VLDGHVVLVQQSAAKPGEPPEAPMRATAGRAVYEGVGQWLHLTLGPRVEDGGLQMTADKIDVSQDSGDAFAHGNVKATWANTGAGQAGKPQNGVAGQGSAALGGRGPAHVIAAEAQLHRATGEATFRGHARLWQQANSVAGPVIVLDRQRQTLVARSADAAEPVRAVLLNAGGAEPGRASGKDEGRAPGADSGKDAAGRPAAPSVIRVRGGDLKYSSAERKAVMRGGALGTVVAETGTEASVSDEVELTLLPPGNHAGKDGGHAQVDRMTARGHVTLTFDVRRASGEQLVYTGETGEYVLTGTAAAPPRMTDPARGTVTGEALIYHSRDGSVSVEGGGRRTTTETTAPK
jgi:lipopolysaccharide export system protein LptA